MSSIGRITRNGTLEQAVTQLRTSAAFALADLIVLNPTTWSKIRRTKDGQGRYVVNPDPTAGEANQLWGVSVLTTTAMTVGVGLVSQLSLGAEARVRQGVTIESTQFNDTNFETNRTTFRVEARIGLAVPRPAAILKVVGL
jgi:HK97 family phage major capsid protein